MDINIRSDVKSINARLASASAQIPYATALAVTSVAKSAASDVTRQLPSIFKLASTFTLRAVGSTAASKRSLTATVFVRPVQAAYLKIQETGGTETPTGTAFVLPIDVRRNASGGMAKGALRAAQGRKKNQAFSGVVHGIPGIWQRAGKTLKLLAEFIHHRTYKAKFGYREKVAASVNANLPKAIDDAIAKALATAK